MFNRNKLYSRHIKYNSAITIYLEDMNLRIICTHSSRFLNGQRIEAENKNSWNNKQKSVSIL